MDKMERARELLAAALEQNEQHASAKAIREGSQKDDWDFPFVNLAVTLRAITAALSTPSTDSVREALRVVTDAAENFSKATELYISDSTYDADGGLAEAEAHLTVTAIPAARAALQSSEADNG